MEYVDEYGFARSYLTPGEAILWRGKPGKGHLLTPQDAYMIPFSIFWCGFAFFLEITAIAGGAPFFFALFGIPFICVGVYITVGRFFHAAYLRKRTAYVITNKKIIRKRGNRVDMLDGRTMPSAHITTFSDGSGTIHFGQRVFYRQTGFNDWSQNGMPFSLENVPDVTRVHQILSNMDR